MFLVLLPLRLLLQQQPKLPPQQEQPLQPPLQLRLLQTRQLRRMRAGSKVALIQPLWVIQLAAAAI